MKRLVPYLLTIPLIACGDGKRDAAEKLAAKAPAGHVVDLFEHDLPLVVTLPDSQSTGGVGPEMGWHEEEGWFEIKAGDHFGLHITEEPGDIARLKADLDRDAIRVSTYLVDRPDLLVYRQQITAEPDLVFVHFYQILHAGERSFVVESDYEGRFNEADVERMRAAVAVAPPA